MSRTALVAAALGVAACAGVGTEPAGAARPAGAAASACVSRATIDGAVRTRTFCGPARVVITTGGVTTRIVGGTCRRLGSSLLLEVGRGVQGAPTSRYARIDGAQLDAPGRARLIVALLLGATSDVATDVRPVLGPGGTGGTFAGTWVKARTRLTGTFRCS